MLQLCSLYVYFQSAKATFNANIHFILNKHRAHYAQILRKTYALCIQQLTFIQKIGLPVDLHFCTVRTVAGYLWKEMKIHSND